jgi:hypothetical protein
VLGLLIASTKTNFDTRSKEIEEFSANLTLLDRELMRLGQEQKDVRALLRDFTARKIAQTWRAGVNPPPDTDDARTVQMLDASGRDSACRPVKRPAVGRGTETNEPLACGPGKRADAATFPGSRHILAQHIVHQLYDLRAVERDGHRSNDRWRVFSVDRLESDLRHGSAVRRIHPGFLGSDAAGAGKDGALTGWRRVRAGRLCFDPIRAAATDI